MSVAGLLPAWAWGCGCSWTLVVVNWVTLWQSGARISSLGACASGSSCWVFMPNPFGRFINYDRCCGHYWFVWNPNPFFLILNYSSRCGCGRLIWVPHGSLCVLRGCCGGAFRVVTHICKAQVICRLSLFPSSPFIIHDLDVDEAISVRYIPFRFWIVERDLVWIEEGGVIDIGGQRVALFTTPIDPR